MDALGADIVTIRDKEYPQLLKNTPDAPLVLYKKGPLEMGMQYAGHCRFPQSHR